MSIVDNLYKSKKLSSQAEDSLVKEERNAFNCYSLMNKSTKDSGKRASESRKRKNNWDQLNNKLSSALKTWEDLSHSVGSKLSPDEEQLQEIKKLLKDLQSRMDEFN